MNELSTALSKHTIMHALYCTKPDVLTHIKGKEVKGKAQSTANIIKRDIKIIQRGCN